MASYSCAFGTISARRTVFFHSACWLLWNLTESSSDSNILTEAGSRGASPPLGEAMVISTPASCRTCQGCANSGCSSQFCFAQAKNKGRTRNQPVGWLLPGILSTEVRTTRTLGAMAEYGIVKMLQRLVQCIGLKVNGRRRLVFILLCGQSKFQMSHAGI